MVEELHDPGNALGYLRSEHETINELLMSCLRNRELPEMQERMLPAILQELEIHVEIEQEYFLPYVSSKGCYRSLEAAPDLGFDSIEQVYGELQQVAPGDPEFNRALERLIQLWHRHMFEMEQNFSLQMEGRDADTHNELIRVANQMKHRKAEYMTQVSPRDRKILSRSPQSFDPDNVQLRAAQEKGRDIYPPRDVVYQNESPRAEREGDDDKTSTQLAGSQDIKTTPDGFKTTEGRKSGTLDESDETMSEVEQVSPPRLTGRRDDDPGHYPSSEETSR